MKKYSLIYQQVNVIVNQGDRMLRRYTVHISMYNKLVFQNAEQIEGK